MIKAIIADVDGILIGEKIGFNSPHPHTKVLQKLKEIRERGVPVILCTAKPYYSTTDIIQGAQLNNPHITDGGAVLIDPVDNVVVEKLTLEKELAKNILQTMLDNNVYVEFYTLEGYFTQKDQIARITKTHELILQRKAKVVDSLIKESTNHEITKIMPIAKNEEDKERVSKLLEQFEPYTSINWGLHPVAFPHQFAFVVNKKTSKREAAKRVMENLHISFENVLGISDTTSDWKFVELCGYAGTLTNGSKEIQKLVTTKGEGNYFIGKSIDENGVLDIFNYFKL